MASEFQLFAAHPIGWRTLKSMPEDSFIVRERIPDNAALPDVWGSSGAPNVSRERPHERIIKLRK